MERRSLCQGRVWEWRFVFANDYERETYLLVAAAKEGGPIARGVRISGDDSTWTSRCSRQDAAVGDMEARVEPCIWPRTSSAQGDIRSLPRDCIVRGIL